MAEFVCTDKQNNKTNMEQTVSDSRIQDVAYVENDRKQNQSICDGENIEMHAKKCLPLYCDIFYPMGQLGAVRRHFEWVGWWGFSFSDAILLYCTNDEEPPIQFVNAVNKYYGIIGFTALSVHNTLHYQIIINQIIPIMCDIIRQCRQGISFRRHR